MSVEYSDFIDGETLSNCCGAAVYTETDICTDCKEHCDVMTEEEYFEG
jgi:hypothetical protein